jgi:hypothetical protein
VPVKYSAGPLPEGREPDLFISITLSPVSVLQLSAFRVSVSPQPLNSVKGRGSHGAFTLSTINFRGSAFLNVAPSVSTANATFALFASSFRFARTRPRVGEA